MSRLENLNRGRGLKQGKRNLSRSQRLTPGAKNDSIIIPRHDCGRSAAPNINGLGVGFDAGIDQPAGAGM